MAVGRIGPALGVRGEAYVLPFTDDPEQRFASGAVLVSEDGRQFTVADSRHQGGRLVVRFEAVDDRVSVEALRGTVLLIDAAARPALDDPDDFYDSDLIGLRAETLTGQPLGPVTDVVHLGGHDYLEVAGHLVPFVAAIVPTIDIASGRVVLDPPQGLFEL